MTEAFNPVFEIKTPKGEMHFIGAAQQYFAETTRDCNQSTKDTYVRDYNERVFPYIQTFLPVAQYTETVITEVLENIRDALNYDETTITSRYRHLLTDPCEAYFRDRNMEDALWGAGYKLKDDDNETREEKICRIRKSLTIQEEKLAAERLLEDAENENGAQIGLAVMLMAGMRNAEVCGLNYGDLIEFDRYRGDYYIRCFQTTQGKTDTLKAGGKTRNAPRLLPIPRRLSELLLKRMAYIRERVSFPLENKAGKVFSAVEELPIACKGIAYGERCTAADLTDAGRKLLRYELRVSEEEFSGINACMQDGAATEEDLGERDVTTYLFRRNMATHLHALGFTQTQVQYYMGHRLENTALRREDFTDEELLHEMAFLLREHPLNVRGSLTRTAEFGKQSRLEVENDYRVSISVPGVSSGEKLFLQALSREISDPVTLRVEGAMCDIAVFAKAGAEQNAAETVNITKSVREAYEKT